MKKITFLIFVFLMCIPWIHAQVYIGSSGYGTDLQAAINAAAENDIIVIDGTLNLNGNIDLGTGVNTLTIRGKSNGKIIFASGGRFIFEQAKVRYIKSLYIDGDSVADRGGVIKMGNAANLNLDTVTIDGGRSGSHGGAIANSGSTITVRNSIFSNNRCAFSGGAIFSEGNGSVSLYKSRFINNWAAAFADNADGKGAALAIIGSNTPGLYAEGCLFYKNNSRNHGGVFIFENSTGTLINCTLAKNKALNAGGVAFLWGPVTLKVINSTLAYNTSVNNTNSPCIKNIHNTNTLEFSNSILYENRDENGSGNVQDIQSDVPHEIKVNNSILSGYSSNIILNGTGNIIGGDISNAGISADINASGVIALSSGSQAVDLGIGKWLTDYGISTDQVDNIRNFAGNRVDAGASELNGSSSAGYVTLKGTSYGTDFGGALLAALDGDTVKVYGLIDITSSKDINAGGLKVVIKGYNGATFKFSSTGADGAGSRFVWATTSGYERKFIDIDFIGDPKGQSDQGAIITMTKGGVLTLENVTMSNGYSIASSGGAIRLSGTGTFLRATNCLFTNNRAYNNGGAIYMGTNSQAIIKNCRFINNQAALRLTDGKGGAIAVNGTPTLGLWAENCSFVGNKSFNNGGAFLFENAKATIINSTIANDTAVKQGGVAFIWSTSTVSFINNTVAYNATLGSKEDGPGLRLNQAVNNVTVKNNFFYKNGSVTDGQFQDITSFEANTNVVVSGSILGGGVNSNTLLSGGVNITGAALSNPGLATAVNGFYMLPLTDSTSQAINLGDTVGISKLIPFDQRNMPRDFVFGKADAGSYEMQQVLGPPPGTWPDSSAYLSLNKLSMAGYQGWFSAQGDGSGQNWVHYAKNGTFGPGSCVIDFWPDMRETSPAEKFPTSFLKNGETAYVYSPYISSTMSRHFRWMDEYGVDGVFMQRFVVDIMNPTTKARLNQVLKNALQAAKASGRAISIMYDLSGIDTTSKSAQEYIDIIKADWGELKNVIGIATFGDDAKGKNQPLLYHKSKAHGGKPYPLVSIWGAGFDDDRKYSVSFVSRLVDFFQNDPNMGQCAVLLGIPTYWRAGGSDVVTGTEYTKLIELIKKVDVILPWHTGRFTRTDFNNDNYKNLVSADVAWCNTNNIDYLPVLSPGFSWRNLKGDPSLTGKPREGGYYYWDMAKAAIEGGANMLYTGMFDEVNEGTQIFKVDNNPPSNTIAFLNYTPNAEDHYLWISGEIRRGLKGETTMTSTLPERAKASDFVSGFTLTRSTTQTGQTVLAQNGMEAGHKIFYADPYSVPDGAPTLNILRDSTLFKNELTSVNDTLTLSSFDQFLRIVEVDENNKVIAFKAVLLDTSILASIADSTGFTDPALNFRASYTQVGNTVLSGDIHAGNSFWAAPAQDNAEFTAMYYKSLRDETIFNMPMESLTSGIPASEGDYIPVVEVNSANEVLGFKVFRITKKQIGRLVDENSDVMQSSYNVQYSGSDATVTIIPSEGYKLYRTNIVPDPAEVPFYGAPYSHYQSVFSSPAVTREYTYTTGYYMSFIEVKDGAVVSYGKYQFNPISGLSVKVLKNPDLNEGEHTIISLEENPEAGHRIWICPQVNPTFETPRVGLDIAEISPIYMQQVTTSGLSVPANDGDYYYLVETDETDAVSGFESHVVKAENISVFANPAIHILQSTFSLSSIGKTSTGKIDLEITPAAGYAVYVSNVMTAIDRIPVYTSKITNNPGYAPYSTPLSLNALRGNNLIITEYNTSGELTGIAIEEAQDSIIRVYYVAENGDDNNNGSQYRPYKTLEKALQNVSRKTSLDSAVTIHVKGTVQLQPAAVEGNGTQISASVKIIGSEAATLLAAPNNRVLELSSAKFYLENLTITGGSTVSTSGGAGIYLHGNRNTYAEFKNCRFAENVISDAGGLYGGGTRIVGASARFISCIFENNQGRNRGGAIGISHGSSDATADYNVVFDGCYIANNVSKFVGTVEGHGGGIFISNSEAGKLNVDIINTTIQGNEAKSAGGAMFIEGSSLALTKVRIINSDITDNFGQNSGNGHGIRMVGAANNTLEIYNSLIWDNGGGTDGTTVDIRNDAATTITCQQSYVKTLATGTTLTGTYKTGEQADLEVLKAPLPAAFANSLFINKPSSFAINYGKSSYLSAVGVNYDATFAERNATDGNIDAGPTEYNMLKFDKKPEINLPIADFEVARNATQTRIDLSEVFTDRDGDPFTYTVTANNNSGVVSTEISGNELVLTYLADMEGNATINVRGTTNNKFVEEEFTVKVGYAPYVANPVPEISILHLNGGNFMLDMSNVFADEDNDASDIELSVIMNSKLNVVTSTSFDNKILNYIVASGKNAQGVVVLTIKAKSGIRTTLTTVTIKVGIPPVVNHLIPSVAVPMNSAPVTRDLTDVFSDPDGEGEIVKTIENNTNPELVTAEISGNLLTLTFAPNKTGDAVITVKAVSDNLPVTTSFNVRVTNAQELIVLNPVQPVLVPENSPLKVIDLSNVFYNMANPSADIVITITGNTNPDLVSASISGYNLSLTFAPESEGIADITLHAVSGSLSADHTFKVGVGDIVLLVINNAPFDMNIGNDQVETKIPLDDVFSVIGNENAIIAIDFNYTNPLLVNAYINYQTNELVISSAGLSTGSSVFTITGSYNGASISTSFTVTILSTGIENVDEKSVKLYPVPVKTVLHCSMSDELMQSIRSVEILSVAGTLVKSFDGSMFTGNSTEINVEDLSSGYYLLRFNTNKGVIVKMFIK